MLAACTQKDSKKVVMEPPPNQIIEGFRLTETVDGRVFYDLTADRAFIYEEAKRIDVTRPCVRFYDEDRGITSTLTSETGMVNSQTSDLTARGSVVVTTKDSTVLETDSLVWRNKEQLIMTDAAVNMRSPEGTIAGIGLVSDANLKKIEIKSTVQATTKTGPVK
jgi:LPS export ABC transporter protein LptC